MRIILCVLFTAINGVIFGQITTTKVAPKNEIIERIHYDSTKNFLGKQYNQYIGQELYLKGAYFVMRSTTKFESPEFMEVRSSSATADQIEEDIVANYSGDKLVFDKKEKDVMHQLIKALAIDQNDGEKKYEYDERVKKEARSSIGVDSFLVPLQKFLRFIMSVSSREFHPG